MNTEAKSLGLPKQTVIDIKDYLSNTAQRAYKKGSQATQAMEKSYPDLAKTVADFAADTVAAAKTAMKSVGDHTSEAAHVVGKHIHRTEATLLKVGILYAAYKYFFRDNDIIATKSKELEQRIKSKPVESAFIALGAGYIVGRLIR